MEVYIVFVLKEDTDGNTREFSAKGVFTSRHRAEPVLGEKLPMKRGKWLSTSVEKHEGNYPDGLVRYDIEYSEMIERCERRFLAPDKDEFRASLERQGLNMKGWNAYKRHKTEYRDFIRAIMPDDVINVIFI